MLLHPLNTALFEAIKINDYLQIRKLAQQISYIENHAEYRNIQKPSLATRNENGQTVLHFALACGALETFKELYPYFDSLDEDVDSIDHAGHSLLWYAALHGNSTIAEKLLKRSAPIGWIIRCDQQGAAPIHMAARNRDSTILSSMLLRLEPLESLAKDFYKCFINNSDKKGRTPLCHAAQLKRLEQIVLLLNRGADPTPTFFQYLYRNPRFLLNKQSNDKALSNKKLSHEELSAQAVEKIISTHRKHVLLNPDDTLLKKRHLDLAWVLGLKTFTRENILLSDETFELDFSKIQNKRNKKKDEHYFSPVPDFERINTEEFLKSISLSATTLSQVERLKQVEREKKELTSLITEIEAIHSHLSTETLPSRYRFLIETPKTVVNGTRAILGITAILSFIGLLASLPWATPLVALSLLLSALITPASIIIVAVFVTLSIASFILNKISAHYYEQHEKETALHVDCYHSLLRSHPLLQLLDEIYTNNPRSLPISEGEYESFKSTIEKLKHHSDLTDWGIISTLNTLKKQITWITDALETKEKPLTAINHNDNETVVLIEEANETVVLMDEARATAPPLNTTANISLNRSAMFYTQQRSESVPLIKVITENSPKLL